MSAAVFVIPSSSLTLANETNETSQWQASLAGGLMSRLTDVARFDLSATLSS